MGHRHALRQSARRLDSAARGSPVSAQRCAADVVQRRLPRPIPARLQPARAPQDTAAAGRTRRYAAHCARHQRPASGRERRPLVAGRVQPGARLYSDVAHRHRHGRQRLAAALRHISEARLARPAGVEHRHPALLLPLAPPPQKEQEGAGGRYSAAVARAARNQRHTAVARA